MAALFEDGDFASILAVLDLAPAMIRDFDGRILHWTTGAAQLYGWSPDEAVGRRAHELLATQFPVPLSGIEAQLLRTGTWRGKLQHTTREGQTLQVASHWALQRDADGQPVAIAEVNTNIGPQEKAEAARIRLAAIVESSDDAIIGKSLDGIVTDWNAAAESLFGYASDDIVGQSVTRLFPPEDIGAEAEILQRIRRGERVAAFATTRRHKDGSLIPVAVSVSPIIDADGAIVGAATIMRDQRAWLERDLRLSEMQAELAHVSRLSELGQLVSALVHEVNQPLTAINNYVSGLNRLLAAGNFEPAPRAVKAIAAQVARADEIIRRYREFLRKGAPAAQSANLAEIVEDSIALASIVPAAKDVSVVTDLGDPGIRVVVDRVQVQQVLFNLMRNAMEAMEGRPDQTLTVAARRLEGAVIELSVADNGPGLPDAVLGNLFKPFVTTKPNGMGVGLSICRAIIEGHGGQMTVETHPSEGAMFRMTLPVDESAAHGHAVS
jgi:two-component system sensor kinase FixL